MANKTALVIRATGSQGRETTRHLLKAGWTVNAFVADPFNPRALALEEMGATLRKGSLDDPLSLESAIQGCTAVFLNQMPSDSEIKDAATVLELAKQAGVKHIVYASTLALNKEGIIERVEKTPVAISVLGKREVEELVRESGMPWTILRPGYFMTNLVLPSVGALFPDLIQGHFITSFKPNTKLPLVDPYDIGAFSAAAFENPEIYGGKIVSVASRVMTVADAIAEISRAAGKDIKVTYRTDEETERLKDSDVYIASQTVTFDMETWIDMEEVEAWGIPLTSFDAFLKKNRDSVVP